MAGTLQQLLRQRLDDAGPAVRHDGGDISWREHLASASRHAAAVTAVLREPDEAGRPPHVGALLGNTPAMLEALAAAALGGYVLVGLNTTRRGPALLADLRRADCRLLLVDGAHRSLLEGLDLTGVRVVDVGKWRPAGELVPLREVGPLDTFMLIFTSGTSGDPKAVRVSHHLVHAAGTMLAERFSITPDDVCYVAMPLFHSNAVVAGWAVGVAAGAAVVPARFSASGFLADVRRHGATYANYVGKPLAYVLATEERPDDADNPLRVVFGNEASDRDIAAFSRRFGCEVRDGFGSTENAVVVSRVPGTPPGSIGRGADGVAVYDSDNVTECPPARFDAHGRLLNADEAVGELVNTTGGGYFTGYYGDAGAEEERLRRGMYWSGDLAYRDADGWVYLAGRTADWMRVDGENLAAAPVERVLLRLPAVSQVAVYGVPDEHVGDQVMATVVLGDGASLTPGELEAFLDEQSDLSAKAWPRYVRIAPSLPATATHKVLKRELIAQGATAGDGVLWVREERGTTYSEARPGR